MRQFHELPCGCKSCGCLCERHSGTQEAEICARHRRVAVVRFLLGEAGAIVALGLFVASAAVWVGLCTHQ